MLLGIVTPGVVIAQASVEELRSKISTQTEEMRKLEADIAKYQAQVNATAKQTSTLQGAVNQLTATSKKLDAEIALTNKKISATTLNIEKLALEIKASERGIISNQDVIRETLRQINSQDGISPLETLIEWKTTADFWGNLASLASLTKKLGNQVDTLKDTKTSQENSKLESEKAKRTLQALQVKLADQKKIAEGNRKATATLLAETKNQEAGYRALLAERQAKRQQVQAEIRSAEEAIKVIIDPARLPTTGGKTLSWPLDKVTITQYFGNTAFATANAQIYSGRGHNAIDLGAPVGTPIKAAAGGKILGTGDTDTVCKGASYGKWVVIVHPNGLATLYAHLSLIKAIEGTTVTGGEIIGYTGNTGYSTGPHLHFSVIASQGLTIGSLQSKVPGCGTYRMPLAPTNSYLNPLSYL